MNVTKKAKETTAAVTNEKVIIAKSQHIGYGQKRKTLEDRCDVLKLELKPENGPAEEVFLGVVADGIGGSNAGEVAGTIATEAITEYIQKSQPSNFRTVLEMALIEAQRTVRSNRSPEMRSMGTTCTAALIHQNKLYLAHVGDSRAYLIRDGKAIQLTLDHTWGNDKLRKGTFTEAEIASNQKSGELMRYIGMPGALEVDMGVHMEDPISPKADPQSPDGLSLQPGDVVLLCTDGLVKERANRPGQFYTTPAELVDVTSKNSPLDAANTLVSLALGRQVDDNVSVVMMEIPGQKKAFVSPAKPAKAPVEAAQAAGFFKSKLIIPIAAVALVALVAIMALVLTTRPAQTSDAGSTVVAASEATPTVELIQAGTMKLLSGEAQFALPGTDAPKSFNVGQGETMPVDAKITTDATRAEFMLPGGVHLFEDAKSAFAVKQLSAGDTGETRLDIINLGSLIVTGQKVTVGSDGRTFHAMLQEGLMAVHFDLKRGQFTVDCLDGSCVLSAGGTQQVTLNGGQRGAIEGGQMVQQDGGPAVADFAAWSDWAEAKAIIPTITPTPSPTPTMTPTITPTPTLTPAPKQPDQPAQPSQPNNGGSDKGGGNDKPKPPADNNPTGGE